MRAECLHVTFAGEAELPPAGGFVLEHGKTRIAGQAVKAEIPLTRLDLGERQWAGAVAHGSPLIACACAPARHLVPGRGRRARGSVQRAMLAHSPLYTAQQLPSGPPRPNR